MPGKQSMHVSKASPQPDQLADGQIRLYSMLFSPYSYRVRLVLAHLGIDYDLVNVHLREMPDWFHEKNPLGKVPVLELSDGRTMVESLRISRYLCEVYDTSELPLINKDPWTRGQQEIFIDRFMSVIPGATSMVFKGINSIENMSEFKKDVESCLKLFSTMLADQPFINGPTVGYVDLMIWPFIERYFELMPLANLSAIFGFEDHPKLLAWHERMSALPAVKAEYVKIELFMKFLKSVQDGCVQYDFQLEEK